MPEVNEYLNSLCFTVTYLTMSSWHSPYDFDTRPCCFLCATWSAGSGTQGYLKINLCYIHIPYTHNNVVITHAVSGIPLAEPEQEVQWGGGYGSPSQDSGGVHCWKPKEALSWWPYLCILKLFMINGTFSTRTNSFLPLISVPTWISVKICNLMLKLSSLFNVHSKLAFKIMLSQNSWMA